MNQIDRVWTLPDLHWTDNSKRELEETGIALVNQTDVIYKVGSVAAVGFLYHSLTSPPWMWFVLAEGVTISDLIDFRRCAEYIPSGTQTLIRADFEKARRFAKLYGFEDTGNEYCGNRLFRKK